MRQTIIILLVLILLVIFHTSYGSNQKPPINTVSIGEHSNFLTQVDDCLIPTASLYGYDLRITAAYRSIADQEVTYNEGRLENGHIVSEAPPGHSLHNYGYAVDVVDRHNGYNIDWTKLVSIGEFCHLESGGSGDLPHFEERGGLTTDQFMAGLRPPQLVLPCSVMNNDHTGTTSTLTLQDLKACGAPNF